MLGFWQASFTNRGDGQPPFAWSPNLAVRRLSIRDDSKWRTESFAFPHDLTLPGRRGRIDQVRGEAAFPQFLEGRRGALGVEGFGIHGQVIHVDPSRGLVIAANRARPEANFSPASLQAGIALFDAIRAALDAEPSAPIEPR